MKFKKPFQILWIVAIVAMASLHFLHLRADFPNYTKWHDWSKFTDEGWYGNAAIQHYIHGSWYMPADFNPAPSVPVWPILEGVLFHFTGVSVVAARMLAVFFFAANLVLSYIFLRTQEKRWVALLAVSFLAASSYLYCFSRLAILEPLLTCLGILALLLAARIGAAPAAAQRARLSILLGVLCVLMILTKTTGLFLLPSVVFSLWYPQRKDFREFARTLAATLASGVTLWLAYFFLWVRPYYLDDYRYFFHINIYKMPPTFIARIGVYLHAMRGLFLIDPTLVMLAIAAVLFSLAIARSLWRNPVFVTSLIAVLSYTLFIGYHNNRQPRYYAVPAFFLVFVAVLATAALLRSHRALGSIALAAIVVSTALNARQTIAFARHPEYTFVNAARDLTAYIDAHPNGNRMLIATSGSDISLITGLPTMCDEFGVGDMPTRLDIYRPGYFAAWNDLDPVVLNGLHSRYWIEQVATFPAFDDPDRNNLVLFKLHPLAPGNGPAEDKFSVEIQ
jgi:4-amino-4-deoxy-L-arabinose transferase-like glycosyltransferase